MNLSGIKFFTFLSILYGFIPASAFASLGTVIENETSLVNIGNGAELEVISPIPLDELNQIGISKFSRYYLDPLRENPFQCFIVHRVGAPRIPGGSHREQVFRITHATHSESEFRIYFYNNPLVTLISCSGGGISWNNITVGDLRAALGWRVFFRYGSEGKTPLAVSPDSEFASPLTQPPPAERQSEPCDGRNSSTVHPYCPSQIEN